MSDPLRREMSILSRTHMNSRCADCRAKGERESGTTGRMRSRGCSGAHCSAARRLESHHSTPVLTVPLQPCVAVIRTAALVLVVAAPPFASSTLGVFLCAPCADCHRQLPDGMRSANQQ